METPGASLTDLRSQKDTVGCIVDVQAVGLQPIGHPLFVVPTVLPQVDDLRGGLTEQPATAAMMAVHAISSIA